MPVQAVRAANRLLKRTSTTQVSPPCVLSLEVVRARFRRQRQRRQSSSGRKGGGWGIAARDLASDTRVDAAPGTGKQPRVVDVGRACV